MNKRITELTPSQEQLLSVYRDKWLSIGLQTSKTIDKVRVRKALERVYKCAGLDLPTIYIYLDNPLHGCIGASLLQIRDQVLSQVADQVWNQVRDQVVNRVRSQAWNQVVNQVENRVTDQVVDQVENQVRDQVWDQIENQIKDLVENQIKDLVENQIRDQVLSQISRCGYGLHDANWLSFYDYLGEVLNLKQCEKLGGLIELSKCVGWWWPFNNAVIITPPPIKLVRDDEHRLHSEIGPALEYPGDFKIHAWHGIRIPSEWIEDKDKLDPRTALQWENLEQRRALCEIIGWDKVLDTLDCKVIHTDNTGDLIETTQIDDGEEIARFVKVQDPSTNRRYVLRVPGDISTAREAVAWTFNIESENYLPVKET